MNTNTVRSLCMLVVAALPWRSAFAGRCNGVANTLCEDFEGGSLATSGWHVTDCSSIGSTNWLSIPLSCNSMTPYPSPAFQYQPTFDENVSVDRIRPPGTANSVSWGWSALGGDFWKTPWPIGKSGQFWVGTYELRPDGSSPWGSLQGDGPQGVAYSPVFTAGGPSSTLEYLTFLIGGGLDINNEKVEMVQAADSYATQCLGASTWTGYYHDCFYSSHWTVPSVWRFTPGNSWDWNGSTWVWNSTDQWLMRPAVATGGMTGSGEQLSQVVWYVVNNGTPSAIRITDASSGGWGHINVDNIQQTTAWPAFAGQTSRLWGLVDSHAHWMNSLSTGANPAPTTPASDYLNALNATDSDGQRTNGSRMMWGLPFYHPTTTANTDGEFSVSSTGGTHGSWNVPVAGCNPLPTNPSQLDGCRFAEANQACSRESHRFVETTGSAGGNEATINGLFLNTAMGAASTDSTNSNDWESFYATTSAYPIVGGKVTGGLHPLWGVDPPGTWSNSTGSGVWRQATRQYLDPIHEAMYYTWVKRAWQGGLRIMSMDVGNSMGLEATLSDLHAYGTAGGSYLAATDDLATIHRQVKAIKQMVNEAEISQFAAIAYNPVQATSIITGGRLALVLGVELDDLGHLRGFEGMDPHLEVAHLKALGIRKLFPVHIPDNVNGGAAVYVNLFNVLNDALGLASPGDLTPSCQGALTCPLASPATPTGGLVSNYLISSRMTAPPPGEVRAELSWDHMACGTANPVDNTSSSCWLTPEHFFTADDSCTGTRVPGDGYCSQFLLSSDRTTCPPWAPSYQSTGACSTDDSTHLWTTDRAAIHFATTEEVVAGGYPHPDVPVYPIPASFGYGSGATPGGTQNRRGLTARGTGYIQAMMDSSMLIDVSHMGEKTKAAVIGRSAAHPPAMVTGSTPGLIWNATANTTAAACSDAFNAGVQSNDPVGAACRAAAYPVIDSHTGFRALKPTFAPPAPWPAQHSPDGSAFQSAALASERDMAPEDVDRVLLSGGMVGIGTGGGAQRAQNTGLYWANNTNRCDGSSASWSQSYYYLLNHLYSLWNSAAQLDSFPGIAFGTDFNGGATQLGTRYDGNNACFSAFDNDHGGSGRMSTPTAQGAAQIALANGVFYGTSSSVSARSGVTGVQPAMTRMCQAMDGTTAPANTCWDFNTQGLSNYGLLPDMLQDIVNQGDRNSGNSDTDKWTRSVVQYDMRWAYQGADQFIKMWTKAVNACKTNARNGAGPLDCLTNTSTAYSGNPDVPADFNGTDANGHLLNPWDGAAYFAGTGRYAVGQAGCPTSANCP